MKKRKEVGEIITPRKKFTEKENTIINSALEKNPLVSVSDLLLVKDIAESGFNEKQIQDKLSRSRKALKTKNLKMNFNSRFQQTPIPPPPQEKTSIRVFLKK
jgi:hypothetical protein